MITLAVLANRVRTAHAAEQAVIVATVSVSV
jgi:hypothetical protein